MSRSGEPGADGRRPLSREVILDAAFRIVDGDERNELTMSRLGRELGADPSAVYRHFRNKDELLLAMADVMLVESLQAYVEGDAPVENLRRMCWTLRRAYLRRPFLARAVAARFTGGAAEAGAVRHLLHNLAELGYGQEQSILRVRALAELTLGHVLMTAELLALPAKTLAFELEMARSYYTHPRDPQRQLSVGELRAAHLTDGEQIFAVMLETFLAGLVGNGPREAT